MNDGVDELYIIELLPVDAPNENCWQLTAFVYFNREVAEDELERHRGELDGTVQDARITTWWRSSWY